MHTERGEGTDKKESLTGGRPTSVCPFLTS